MAPPAFYKLVTVGAGLAGLGGLQSILLVPSHGLLDANLEKRPKFQAIDLITLSSACIYCKIHHTSYPPLLTVDLPTENGANLRTPNNGLGHH